MKQESPFNITDYCLKNFAKLWQSHVALILSTGSGDEMKFTYKELYHKILKIATGLKALKFPPKTSLLISAENSLESILLFFGAMRASLVPCMCPPDLTEREILEALIAIDARLLYQGEPTFNTASLPLKCSLLKKEKIKEFLALSVDLNIPHTKASDPAYIVLTENETGEIKGITYPHKSVLSKGMGVKPKEIVLYTHPLNAYSLTKIGFFDTLSKGGICLSLIGSVTPSECFEVMKKYKVNILVTTSQFFEECIRCLETKSVSFAQLREVFVSGTITKKTKVRGKNFFKAILIEIPETQKIKSDSLFNVASWGEIAAKEIEKVFLKEGSLLEIAFIETAGEDHSERFTLFAVPKTPLLDYTSYMLRLTEFASKNLCSVKHPDRVVFLRKMPKTASGEIDRLSLKSA